MQNLTDEEFLLFLNKEFTVDLARPIPCYNIHKGIYYNVATVREIA